MEFDARSSVFHIVQRIVDDGIPEQVCVPGCLRGIVVGSARGLRPPPLLLPVVVVMFAWNCGW